MTHRDHRSLALVLLQPSGIAAGYVLISFAATPTPRFGLWRPLAVAITASVLVAVLLGLALRNARLASLIGSALVLAVAAPWLSAMVIGTVLLWILLVALLRRRSGRLAGWRSISLPAPSSRW